VPGEWHLSQKSRGVKRLRLLPAVCRPAGSGFHGDLPPEHGCSHFIIGRDHTGIKDYYKPDDSRRLFETVGAIGITPVFFGAIGYDPTRDSYGEELNGHLTAISGTEVRDALREGRPIPNWMVRQCVQDALHSERKAGRSVFVE